MDLRLQYCGRILSSRFRKANFRQTRCRMCRLSAQTLGTLSDNLPSWQTEEDFDLIEQKYDTDKLLPNNGKLLSQWQRFAHKLKVMNQRAPRGVTYRLLYLGRHGQGYHNVGIMFYGDAAWDVSLVISLQSQSPNPNLILCHRRSVSFSSCH